MARLYADEDFSFPVVVALRRLGQDVVTAHEHGRANQGIDDPEVLADAIALDRALLTHNHSDFKRLHNQAQSHEGIISCTQDGKDPGGLAQRIQAAVQAISSLKDQFIRIVRPNPSTKP